MNWIHENPPHWDENKAAVVASAPPGVLRIDAYDVGDLISGEWWRVEDGGAVLGYGWMDTNWGDAEILLAVAAEHRQRGVGTFILDHLEREAAARGLNYMYNIVPGAHPDPEGFTKWLCGRGFSRSDDDRYRRRVQSAR